MSTHAHNSTDALSPYTRDYEQTTPAITPQRSFAQRLRGILARINARIREAIIEDDLLARREDTEALVDDVPDEIFNFPTDRGKIRGFLRWLRVQLDTDYLTVVGADRNQFLRQAYAMGVREAHRQLQDADIAFQRPDIDDLLGRPFHRSALQELYTRTYEHLQSVRDDVAQAVREELLAGFTEGDSPTAIARRLTDRVDSIGKYRSTLIARSEVMNAHSTATLNRVQELNRDTEADIATGHGQWDAAVGSPRTCAFCRAINGVELTPREMATTAVVFTRDGQTYRLKPPAHPQGRCNIRLIVGSSIDTPLSDRLPDSVQLIT